MRPIDKTLNYLKILLFVIVLLLVVVNFFALMQVLDTLTSLIDNWLHGHGYTFSIKSPVLALYKWGTSVTVIGLYIKKVIQGAVFVSLSSIFNAVKIWQLILLMTALPFLLYVQNNAHIKMLKYGK